MDGTRLLMQRVAVNVKGESYGWPARSVIFICAVFALCPSSAVADTYVGPRFDTDWLGKEKVKVPEGFKIFPPVPFQPSPVVYCGLWVYAYRGLVLLAHHLKYFK